MTESIYIGRARIAR